MNTTIIIRECEDSKFQVFDGELLLACFGNKDAAQKYAQITSSPQNPNSSTTPSHPS